MLEWRGVGVVVVRATFSNFQHVEFASLISSSRGSSYILCSDGRGSFSVSGGREDDRGGYENCRYHSIISSSCNCVVNPAMRKIHVLMRPLLEPVGAEGASIFREWRHLGILVSSQLHRGKMPLLYEIIGSFRPRMITSSSNFAVVM